MEIRLLRSRGYQEVTSFTSGIPSEKFELALFKNTLRISEISSQYKKKTIDQNRSAIVAIGKENQISL